MSTKINLQFLISYFGLIPYVLTFLDKYYVLLVDEADLLNFVTSSSLIIIVFIENNITWSIILFFNYFLINVISLSVIFKLSLIILVSFSAYS